MEIYLGLGSNLGDKCLHLRTAINEIEKRIGHVECQSAFVETEPWGFESDNTFVNAVVRVDTALSPLDLLKETQTIEREMGRTHKTVDGKYSDRIIDIDILLYGDAEINLPELVVPHPRMYERDFVMKPLEEVRSH
ncbi:MAG: 2-amino-4-hydroxy-6-hydroxymethyldihydropteridine diphosphokinase [Bacteroidaceae bacterium]|nr:2-amino-4-hydroxy-6-hydroxymethyldihydropteridine diphosphokinase [Bacteroidaceae bacterium]